MGGTQCTQAAQCGCVRREAPCGRWTRRFGSLLDEQLIRRLLELELRQVKDALERLESRLKEDISRVERAATTGPPWWTSYLFAVLFAMISGWIGMIHLAVRENSAEAARLASVQYQHLYIPPELEDMKRRLAASEALALRIPDIQHQLRDFGSKIETLGKDVGIKLDRLFERRGETPAPGGGDGYGPG